MSASCSGCSLWSSVAKHGRGTATGYCTHPAQARVTRGDYSCRNYVRDYGLGHDENAAIDAFLTWKARGGVTPGKYRAQDPVNTDLLRARSAKYGGRRVA